MNDRPLGNFEFRVLSAVAGCRADCYGLSILDQMEAEGGGRPAIGALYTTLDRLEKKGLLKSEWGEPTAQRGGRRKRMYCLTAGSQAALSRTREAFGVAIPSWSPAFAGG